MSEITYKGFTIKAAPFKLHDGNWNTYFWITVHTDDGPKSRNFNTGDTFPTEEEAVESCLQFGRDIIDGKVEGCSVEDL